MRDAGATSAAAIQYGEGVISVNDPPASTTYTITFGRSVENCVINATPRVGRPSATSSSEPAIQIVNMTIADPDQATVRFLTHACADIESAFFVTAFC